MPRKRVAEAHKIIEASVSGYAGGGRKHKSEPFSSQRIRANIRAVLGDADLWLTPAYTLAIQAEHLLQVIEGKRTQEGNTDVA